MNNKINNKNIFYNEIKNFQTHLYLKNPYSVYYCISLIQRCKIFAHFNIPNTFGMRLKPSDQKQKVLN